MTDRELKKLSRTDLLELLLAQSKEIDRLKEELEQARAQLEKRELQMEEAGSLADAAVRLSGVFEAAQQAADLYLANVRTLSARQETVCEAMEERTKKKCDAMIAQAKQESQQYWDAVSARFRDFYVNHPEMRQHLSESEREEFVGEAT